jgi:hypothetical protein
MLDKEFKKKEEEEEKEIIYVVYDNLFLKIYFNNRFRTIATISIIYFIYCIGIRICLRPYHYQENKQKK